MPISQVLLRASLASIRSENCSSSGRLLAARCCSTPVAARAIPAAIAATAEMMIDPMVASARIRQGVPSIRLRSGSDVAGVAADGGQRQRRGGDEHDEKDQEGEFQAMAPA